MTMPPQKIEFKRNWQRMHIISGVNISVAISQSNDKRPRFTLQFGRVYEDNFTPYVSVYIEGQGKVSARSQTDEILRLTKEAEEWITFRAQTYEDENIEKRIAKETRNLPKPLVVCYTKEV